MLDRKDNMTMVIVVIILILVKLRVVHNHVVA